MAVDDTLDKIVVELTGKVGDLLLAIAKADAALDTFAKKTEETNTRTKKSTKESGSAVTDFARLVTAKLKDGESAFSTLGREIDTIRPKIAQLRQDFTRTGNESVFGNLQQAEADLKKLEGFMVQMEPRMKKVFATTGYQSGKSMMDSIDQAVEQDAQKLKIPFMPGGAVSAPMLGAISGALAPAIVAALAGAVTLGVGTIGLIIGAELEKSNVAVQSAFGKMKQEASSTLTEAASPFIAGLSNAFAQLGTFFQQNSKEFSAFFSALEPAIQPIVSMLTDLVHTIMPGLTALAGAFAKAMASSTVQGAVHAMAESINLFFQTIADNQDMVKGFFVVLALLVAGVATALAGATEGVKLFAAGLGFTGGASDATTGAILKLIDTQKDYNDSLYAYDEALSHGTESLFTFTGQLITDVAVMGNNYIATQSLTDQYKALQQQLNSTTITASTLAGEMTDKLFNSIMNSRRATLSWNESLLNLSDTLRKNKNDLRDHTHAGQADQAAILDALQANLGIYDSMIQAGYSADKATAAYEANIASLEQLMHQAGLSDSQIKTMVGDLATAPHDVNIAIAIEGLATAIDQFKELIAQINGVPIALHKLTAASYNTVYGGTGDQGAGRASGGGGNPSLPKTHPTSPKPPPLKFQKWGGVVAAYQQAGIFQGAGTGLLRFAEEATREEAYIPKVGDEGRAVSTLREAARWHKMQLRPMSDGLTPTSGGGYGPTAYVPINVYLGGQQMVSLHAALIPVAQEYRRHNRTTGLETPVGA